MNGASIHRSGVQHAYRTQDPREAEEVFFDPLTQTRIPIIPAVVEHQGAQWQGEVETLTLDGAVLRIEGFPPLNPSFKLRICIDCRDSFLEIPGSLGMWEEVDDPAFGGNVGLRLRIRHDEIDDLKRQRLKRILGEIRAHPHSSSVYIHVLPPESQTYLWEMQPATSPSEWWQKAALVKSPPTFPAPFGNGFTELASETVRAKGGPGGDSGLPSCPHVQSTLLEWRNAHGQRIVGYYDRGETVRPESPVILISPGYGETKREYLTLAYFFALNGFHVLRYDHSNHVGESDGEHHNTTLTSMRDDLRATLDYVAAHWPNSPVALISTSLGGRVALKALATGRSVDVLILLTPVVDVRNTLLAVHREDLIAQHRQGVRKGLTNVLGLNVELDHWLADAIEQGYGEMASTLQDVRGLHLLPILLVSAEHDAWVETASLQTVVSSLGRNVCRWLMVPKGLHRLQENPQKARLVFRQLVQFCHERFGQASASQLLVEPSRKLLGVQNRRERERKRSASLLRSQPLAEFWEDYLSQFHYIVNFGDYRQLLEHVFTHLGPLSPGMKVLDAGCGNGHFGAFLFDRTLMTVHRRRRSQRLDLQYVGIDFVGTAIRQARDHLRHVIAQHGTNLVTFRDALSVADLNAPLPFPDGTFDKVVSNLVLGYVKDPEATLQELFRVLSPQGTLVLTNLKPNSDLSRIFLNFVEATDSQKAVDEAKALLNNSGKIREAEGDGIFHFPDEEELTDLLRKISGGKSPKIVPTFADQAYLAVISKGDGLRNVQETWSQELPQVA